jgi:hypothetical protein
MRGVNWFLAFLCVSVLASPAASLAAQDDGRLIDDFERDSIEDRWWWYEEGAAFACEAGSPGYNSERALMITFTTGPEQWPGCGTGVPDAPRWAAAEGLSFVWRSDQPGLNVIVTLLVEDPTQETPGSEGYTPFEVFLEAPGDSWTPVTLPWTAFAKAEWVSASGANTLDVTRAADLIWIVNAAQQGVVWIDDLRLMGGAAPSPAPPPSTAGYDKFALWTNGTQLRGINIWQRVVVPEIDGLEILGSDHVGPPYTLEDFAQISQLGANYVNISGPGLFTERPPYALDEGVQANLDTLLALIEEADMFAVISFRTGPGRSDFTFYDENIEEWGDPSLVLDNVWTDQAAQDAWVEMWRYTADRYRDNPIVVGYDLMVEPNAAGRLLDIYDPAEFYPAYAGTLYDWNQLHPRIVAAIREVDGDTPILIAASSWGAVFWLPYLQPVGDSRVVYTVHQYEPQEQYTHQEPGGANTYPGSFDLDYDGSPDAFGPAWLDGYLSTIDSFKAQHGAPVAVNEYGVRRWVPNAADFMRDQMDLFEKRGLNHAFWAWTPLWPPQNEANDGFDFLHGPDPDNHADAIPNALYEIIVADWSRNTVRPSAVIP